MKIFISYAHENASAMMPLPQVLHNHEVWFDHRLLVGQDWWQEIEQRIAACHCFIFALTPAALTSEYCQKELAQALKLEKAIAPIMLVPMEIPESLKKFQVISLVDGLTPDNLVKLLNGIFEIERQVFNPLKPPKPDAQPSGQLAIQELHFATSNLKKKAMYEQILNVELKTATLDLPDVQHLDAGEVALHKVQQAYDILRKPVFVDHSALAIRAWGGLPGGLTSTFIVPVGLSHICKMLEPFADKYAEAISVIAFTDGQMRRKFVGAVAGEIPAQPRGNGYSWNNIFIPEGFHKTLGEMTEAEILSISSRRRAMVAFMRFLQENYQIV